MSEPGISQCHECGVHTCGECGALCLCDAGGFEGGKWIDRCDHCPDEEPSK